ncbi:MAG: hypothetical protein IJX02_03415 [Clostridia bacterium]|nr:hypothetical protein [Clostridia bacterium]
MNELNKRLRKNKILTLASAALMVLFIVLTLVGLFSENFILAILGFFCFSAFLGITYGFIYYKKLIKRSYCPSCGTHYSYDTDISWEEIQRYTKQMTKQEKVIAKVNFDCKCPSCQQSQTFTADFVIYEHNFETNKEKVNNLRDMAKKYFV